MAIVSWRSSGHVVGWKVGDIVSNDIEVLRENLNRRVHILLITDKEVRFMRALDMGNNFARLLDKEPIFHTDEIEDLLKEMKDAQGNA